jgi:hypothetical protein
MHSVTICAHSPEQRNFVEVVIRAALDLHKCYDTRVESMQASDRVCVTQMKNRWSSRAEFHGGIGILGDHQTAPAEWVRLNPTAPNVPDVGVTKLSDAKSLYIVLGNMPLFPTTASVDTLLRVRFMMQHVRETGSPAAVLFTGGATAGGTVTEAQQMAWVGNVLGLRQSCMLLEESATSTQENAELSAELLKGTLANVAADRIFIVSKQDHLEWGFGWFKPLPVFSKATGIGPSVRVKDITDQMEHFVSSHAADSDPALQRAARTVKQRLVNLRNGQRGID